MSGLGFSPQMGQSGNTPEGTHLSSFQPSSQYVALVSLPLRPPETRSRTLCLGQGLVSVTLFPALLVKQPPTRQCLWTNPHPTPAGCQVPEQHSLPAQHLLTLQPPASLCLQQNPRALPLPPQPALGGPTFSHSCLISVCVRRKGISFAIYPRSSLQKELKDTLRSVKKTRPQLAKRAQVVILIMWNNPLFMENFLL